MASNPRLLDDIVRGTTLHHVDQVADKSSPAIEEGTHLKTWDKDGFMQEVQSGVPLKHVETMDKSVPVVEADAHIGPNHHNELLQEVKAAAGHRQVVQMLKQHSEEVHLHHVDTLDKGKPLLDPNVHVHKWDKQAFLQEVNSPRQLKHVNDSADRSGPVIEPDVHIKPNPHTALMSELTTATSGKLQDDS